MRKTHKFLKDGTKMTWPECQYNQHRWLAVMDYKNEADNATQKEIDKVFRVYTEKAQAPTWYVAFTDLRKSGMPYPRIFAAVKTLRVADPYTVRLNINRMGECVYVAFSRKITKKGFIQ